MTSILTDLSEWQKKMASVKNHQDLTRIYSYDDQANQVDQLEVICLDYSDSHDVIGQIIDVCYNLLRFGSQSLVPRLIGLFDILKEGYVVNNDSDYASRIWNALYRSIDPGISTTDDHQKQLRDCLTRCIVSPTAKIRRLTLIWAVDESLHQRFDWAELVTNYESNASLIKAFLKEFMAVFLSKNPSLKRFSTSENDVSADELWTLFLNAFIQGKGGVESIEVSAQYRMNLLDSMLHVMSLDSEISSRADLDRFQVVIGKVVCRYIDTMNLFLRKQLKSDIDMEWLEGLELRQDVHVCEQILEGMPTNSTKEKALSLIAHWTQILAES